MFAVGLSTLVISSDPRLRLGAELMPRVENPTANTVPRIGNSTWVVPGKANIKIQSPEMLMEVAVTGPRLNK